MAKVFSIAPWNVEHYRGDPVRTDRWIDDYSDHCYFCCQFIYSYMLKRYK